MPDPGWVKLWRKVTDSAVWADSELFKLFTMCLLKANHRQHWWSPTDRKRPVLVGPGQFITGRDTLHRDYYPPPADDAAVAPDRIVTPRTLWRWLNVLQDMEIVTLTTTTRYTLVSITKWEQYQGDTGESDGDVSNGCPTGVQRVSNGCPQTRMKKNDKNKKKTTTAVFEPLTVPIPENLDTPAFREAWTDWIKFRRGMRKPITKMAAQRQMALLGRAGLNDALSIIDCSITNDWQGLFPLGRRERRDATQERPDHAAGF